VYRIIGEPKRDVGEQEAAGTATSSSGCCARPAHQPDAGTNWRTERKPSVRCPVDEIMRLHATGIRHARNAERLEIGEASVYRIVLRECRKAGLAPPVAGRSAYLSVWPRSGWHRPMSEIFTNG
jgi:hypothetical protein